MLVDLSLKAKRKSLEVRDKTYFSWWKHLHFSFYLTPLISLNFNLRRQSRRISCRRNREIRNSFSELYFHLISSREILGDSPKFIETRSFFHKVSPLSFHDRVQRSWKSCWWGLKWKWWKYKLFGIKLGKYEEE